MNKKLYLSIQLIVLLLGLQNAVAQGAENYVAGLDVVCPGQSVWYEYVRSGTNLCSVSNGGYNGGWQVSSNGTIMEIDNGYPQRVQVRWNTAGTGWVKANTSPALSCNSKTRNVTIGLQPVGNISGPTTIRCNGSGSVSYSMPGVTNASRYDWSINEPAEMGFSQPALSNGGTTITYQVAPVSGPTNGATLSVTVSSNCFSEAPVTRTVTLYRSNVEATVTQGLPTGVCYGNRYPVRATDGNNFRWVANFLDNTGMVVRSDTYFGSPVTISIPTDTRIRAVNYVLYYTNLCNGQNAQTGGGTYVASTGCTPGARMAAQEEQETAGVYPNPVADVLKIHIPEAANDGGFTAELRDVLQRGTLKGRTPGSSLQLDVRQLPAGVYLLRTERASGGVSTQKVLIVH